MNGVVAADFDQADTIFADKSKKNLKLRGLTLKPFCGPRRLQAHAVDPDSCRRW